MRAATVVQQLCKSCRTCFKFYCMFYFTCDRFFNGLVQHEREKRRHLGQLILDCLVVSCQRCVMLVIADWTLD